MMYANARPGGSLEALSGDLLRQARQLADGGPAEDELQRVKKVSPGAEFILPRCHAPPAVPPPDSCSLQGPMQSTGGCEEQRENY